MAHYPLPGLFTQGYRKESLVYGKARVFPSPIFFQDLIPLRQYSGQESKWEGCWATRGASARQAIGSFSADGNGGAHGCAGEGV